MHWLTEERQQQLIGLCQSLIRIRSYSGQEQLIVKYLQQAFAKLGYDDVAVDHCGSLIGHIKGKRPGKRILFEGHLDTVPVVDPTDWSHQPFGGELAAGRIYGRGASDMKGAVAAMVCAAAYLAHDLQKDFAGDIYVAGAVHEECFEGMASRSISALVQPDLVVIGEASEGNVNRAQRGRAEIVVETLGKPAHSANPGEGINAVYQANELIDRIRSLRVSHHDFMGDGILELTDIQSSPYPGASVVPDRCRMTYDRRLLVGETRESVLQPLVDLIAQLAGEHPDFQARAYFARGEERCYTGAEIQGERFFPGWMVDEHDPDLQAIFRALQEAGLDPVFGSYSFCTDGSHYAGEAGIKTIGFGPSRESLAHVNDEYVEIDQLIRAATGYYAIAKKYLSEATARSS